MEQHEVDGILRDTQRSRQAAGSQPASFFNGTLALMLVAGIAATGAFATLFAVWYRSAAPNQTETLRIALDEYVAGRYVISRQLADSVIPDMEADPVDYRVKQFLLGASGIHLAAEVEDPFVMREEIANSLPHLEWLAGAGFPPGRIAEGQRLLGLGQRSLGRFEKAIIPLEIAIEEDPTMARELLLPLAEAKLRAAGVKATRAEEDVNVFLKLPKLPNESKDQAYLLLARIKGKMRDFAEARSNLQRVKGEDLRDEVDLTLAELFIEEAKEIVANYKRMNPTSKTIPLAASEVLDEAAAILENLSRRNEVEFGAAARYLAGITYRIAGKNEDALGVFASIRQNNKFPAEAIASGVEEIELLTELGLYGDALLALRAVVRVIGDPKTFDPKWLSLLDVQSRFLAVGLTMRTGGGHRESIEYAESLPPVVDSADALQMKAESHRDWGVAYRDKGRLGDADAMRLAREQFREAGVTFEEVANLRFTEPDYTELLWESISAFQAGRAYEESLELLENYLQYEDRRRLPRGLLAKGRALAALEDHRSAIVALGDCIEEFPRDPLSYEARLLAAVSEAELGNMERAREHLETNVTDEWLSPKSPIFRDSLYVLGDLLYRQAMTEYLRLTLPTLVRPRLSPGGRPSPEDTEDFHTNQLLLQSAIDKLEEAYQRDLEAGNQERSRRSAYLAAEAHRVAAFWPTIQAADPETLQSARNRLNQERALELKKSNEGFSRLRENLLEQMSRRQELSTWEQTMLRNCYMGIADTYFELGDIVTAATAYQKALQEFMNEPLALEALMQQARCYELLGRQQEAENIYKQAVLILSRIPLEEDQRFSQTTRYTREDWSELLDWLQGS